MIKFEYTETVGWEAAIRGMRNPMNSWDKSDSMFDLICDRTPCSDCPADGHDDCYGRLRMCTCKIGPNDHELMMKLRKAGTDHRKFMRMIVVYVDITAPLYWWKEYDTYKVGTVANSCSTMHKIHEKAFTLEDFSTEHLFDENADYGDTFNLLNDEGVNSECCPTEFTKMLCEILNFYRDRFLETNDKKYWWQMIQLLPSSYNQKRTLMLNYEVLANIYHSRKNHKLDEWKNFCKWIESLPYPELITGEWEIKESED